MVPALSCWTPAPWQRPSRVACHSWRSAASGSCGVDGCDFIPSLVLHRPREAEMRSSIKAAGRARRIVTWARYARAARIRNSRSVETSCVLRLRILVTRLREVLTDLATWACVKPLGRTIWMIRSFNSLCASISAASRGDRPKAAASSAGMRVAMAIRLHIEQLLESHPSQFNLPGAFLLRLLHEKFG